MEATPGIEIGENRHPKSHLASNNHFVTQVQRPTSCQSPSFLLNVHKVVPNPYQTMLNFPNQGQTLAYVRNYLFLTVRTDDGNIMMTSLSEAEYFEGKAGSNQSLVEALLNFDYLRAKIKETNPEEYERILDVIIASGRDSENQE